MRKRTLRTVPAPVEAPQPKIVKTPEVRADDQLKNLIYSASCDSQYARRQCDDWAARFATNPASAFEWSSGVFKQAARHQVAEYVIAFVKQVARDDDEYAARSSRKVLEILAQELRSEVMRNAKYPESSTSPTSNHMSLCLMSARAETLEKVENAIARLDQLETLPG
jgi:hypothetical protein